jgi:hypothetical protein
LRQCRAANSQRQNANRNRAVTPRRHLLPVLP